MDNLIACYEITSDGIKVLVGYELGGAPVVLFKTRRYMPGLIKDGAISDSNALIRALAELHTLSDEASHLRIQISKICLALPSLGLRVFESVKSTNVVSNTNEIAKIDVTNVVSLVRKEPIPQGNAIVDIIPDVFQLANGAVYVDPPLGVQSTSLTIKAKIHALPENVSNAYTRLLNQAGYRIQKASVSAYCEAELFKTYPDLPKSYLLVDLGAGMTTVTLVGEGAPYSSATFHTGGRDLTEAIAIAFSCPFEVAEKLKCEYGFRERLRGYEPALPLPEGGDAYYQKDLNEVITSFFESYGAMLGNAISALVGPYNGKLDSFPIIFTGGASGLRGMDYFIKRIFPSRKAYYPIPRSIGARERGYSALLGLLLTSARYTGSLEDNYRGMGTVSRVEKGKGKAKPTRNSPDTDVL